MKAPESVLHALPLSAPADRPALSFPKRATVAELRRRRDRHFREGQHDLALQIAAEVAGRDPGRESFLKHGMLLQQVGRYREALEVLRDALRFESGPAYLTPDIHLHLAYTWFLLGKRKRMGESLKRAKALRLKPRTACNIHMTIGNDYFIRRDFLAAQRSYLEAEKSANNAMQRGRALLNQGIALIRCWDFAAAEGPLDRALRVLKKAGHAGELAIARSARASIYAELKQHRRAMTMFLHAARTFRRLGKVDREAEVLSNAATNAGELGLWAKAHTILNRVIGLASVTGQHLVLSCAYATRAMACAQDEDFDLAAASLEKARRMVRGRQDWIGALHVCRAQARIAAQVGKWDEVFRVSRRAERMAVKIGDALRVVEFRKLRADAEGHLGRAKASAIARNSADRLEILIKTPKGQGFAELADRLAATEMPVLVLGDGGTNRTGIARKIHEASGRAKGPFVVVPCEQLTFPASDLYGHAEGAWSGATRSSQGFVNAAQGGTLVLDCVDQMPAGDQQVLIPLLDRRTRAVGGVDERVLDVRIIATCSSLDGLTHELRSRLEGALLRVPSLKERKTEIPHQVVEMIGGRRKISPDALADLARHPWEGNLVELRGVVDRLVALSDGRIGRKLVRRILMTAKTHRVAGRVHAPRASRAEAVLTR